MTILKEGPSAVTWTLPSFLFLRRQYHFISHSGFSVPFSINLFVVSNFKLTATGLLFHKLWLIFPGLGGILFVTWSHRDRHQFPHHNIMYLWVSYWLITKCWQMRFWLLQSLYPYSRHLLSRLRKEQSMFWNFLAKKCVYVYF